jgi:bla regulator protein BlaR1
MISPSFIGWAIETLVATTVLMLLVLVLRGPVRKAFGSNMAYALWLLPVLRMALPPLPQSWREQAAAPIAAAGDAFTVYVIEPLGGAADAGTAAALPIDWIVVVGTVWAMGATAFLGFHLISHSRFCAKLLRRARIDGTVAQGRVRVIETDAAHGPLAFGIWRKYVAFPRDFAERYDEVERDLALAHELGHHVRGDLIANWVALVVLALHWFNPVAWKAFRAFRADQEMACDALVLAGRHQALRHAYGRAIVKSAHGGAVSAACHLHTINEVKGRLRMLSKTRSFSPTRTAAGLIGVGALSVAALGFTASGTQAAETLKAKVETVTGVSLGQQVPRPPEAPEAPAVPHKMERHVYSFAEDGKKDGKRVRKMVIVHADGSKDEVAMPDMEAIRASIPEIRDGNCGKGDAPTVEHRQIGDKKIMIICHDRIEAMADNATQMAMRHKTFWLDSARMGLRMARRSVESQTDMSADERARALKGIDEAMAEFDKQHRED